MKYLEPLFCYLRETKSSGITSMTFNEIEKVIGHKLSDGLKKSKCYWHSPYIKIFKDYYKIEIREVNANAGYVNFKVL